MVRFCLPELAGRNDLGRDVATEVLLEVGLGAFGQLFLLLGVLFVIPVVLGYTAWSYWVFRGKVRGGGYH